MADEDNHPWDGDGGSGYAWDGIELTNEQVAQVLDWAVGTGIIALLMAGAPQHKNAKETLDKLHTFMNGLEVMLRNLPEFMGPYIAAKADLIVEDTIAEEKIVSEFLKELDEL